MLLSCLPLHTLFTTRRLDFSVLIFNFFWSNSALILNHRIDFGLGLEVLLIPLELQLNCEQLS